MVMYGRGRIERGRRARPGRWLAVTTLAVTMLTVAAVAAGCGSSSSGSSPGAASGAGSATASGGSSGPGGTGTSAPGQVPTAGPSSSVPATTPGGAASSATVDCTSVIATSATPAAGRFVILNAVALPEYQQLAATASGSTDPAARLFAKIGLQVRAGTTVDLVVPSALTGRARVGWGNGAAPTASARVSCPVGAGAAGQPWVTLAGGFYASAPFCLPLIVRTPTGSASVTIGIGTSCRQSGPVR